MDCLQTLTRQIRAHMFIYPARISNIGEIFREKCPTKTVTNVKWLGRTFHLVCLGLGLWGRETRTSPSTVQPSHLGESQGVFRPVKKHGPFRHVQSLWPEGCVWNTSPGRHPGSIRSLLLPVTAQGLWTQVQSKLQGKMFWMVVLGSISTFDHLLHVFSLVAVSCILTVQ